MKILVLGSLNIDRVYRVHNFVRPKETIHAQSFICTCGGKGFNQSIALARAGSKIVFAGIAGVDGSMLIEMDIPSFKSAIMGRTVFWLLPEQMVKPASNISTM